MCCRLICLACGGVHLTAQVSTGKRHVIHILSFPMAFFCICLTLDIIGPLPALEWVGLIMIIYHKICYWFIFNHTNSTFLRMNLAEMSSLQYSRMSQLVCLWKPKSHLCLWEHLRLLISSGFVLLLSVTSLLCYSASHQSLIPSANTTWCADSNVFSYGCAVFSRWFKCTCNSL